MNIVASTLGGGSGKRGWCDDFDRNGGYVPTISPALKSRDYKGPSSDGDGDGAPLICHTLRAEGFDASEDGTGRGIPLVASPITAGYAKGTGVNDGRKGSPQNIIPVASAPAVAFQTRIARNGRGQPKEICDALTSSEGGSHADSKPHVATASAVRRLTPRECERLMGLPDDFTRWDDNGSEISDSARYRMCGNSIVYPVALWIVQRMRQQDTSAD